MKNLRLLRIGLVVGLLSMTYVASAADAGSTSAKEAAPRADAVKPLAVGQMVPAVDIQTTDDKAIALSKAVEGQATAIVFYRGHWCPYCLKHLKALESIAEELSAMGVKLVAISPDRPDIVAETVKKGNFTMAMYSDSALNAAKELGVAFALDPDTAARYKESLVENTGHDLGLLPVPAVFLTDKTGKITFVHSNPDYKLRLSNEELLAAVKQAQAKS